MVELNLKQLNGAPANGAVIVAPEVFDVPFNEPLVHQVVTAYLAGARAGTKAQKGRTQVSGGGTKPWRQKGTGRARAGTIRSPLWRGGGVAFAAQPRSFSQKVNRKMYHGALRAILAELVRKERLIVVEEMTLEAPRTKELLGKLENLAKSTVLLIKEAEDTALALAARNLPNVQVMVANQVNPVSLIAHDTVVMTVPALKQLEGSLA